MINHEKLRKIDLSSYGASLSFHAFVNGRDAFFSGVAMGLTYGKSLRYSCEIGARLASSVITVLENTCPRFLPEELGLELGVCAGSGRVP